MRFKNKNWSKLFALLIVFTMVLQFVGPIASNYSFADGGKSAGEDVYKNVVKDVYNEDEAVDDENVYLNNSIQQLSEIQENWVTEFNLTVFDNDNNKTEIEHEDELEFDIDEMSSVNLVYTVEKPNDVKVKAGDTYTIDLPDIFKDSGEPAIDIVVNGKTVGTYNTTGNQSVITFTDEVESFDDVTMHVYINGEFNKEIFETEREVEVEVPYKDETSYSVTIKAKEKEYNGEDKKEAGKPYVINEDGLKTEVDRNPTHIDWTVRANDNMGSFDNATIIDELGANLEIVEGSFVVERIIRNYQNKEIGRDLIDVTPKITDAGFELYLGKIEDAYEITYTTKVNRPEGGGTHTINNTARIILDGEENQVIGDFEGNWSGDIPIVEKNGEISEDRDDVIDWVVEYNYGKENLGTVSLTDTLTYGEVILNTVKVIEVETNNDGEITAEKGTVNVEAKIVEGELIIPNLDAKGKAYLITFSSTVPVGLNDKVVNTISDDLDDPNSDDASVDVNTVPTGGKIGEQLVDKDGRPYIKWTITMNSGVCQVSCRIFL